ncbi:MAG: hypothetical protein JSR59_26970 [Proteobacteria bacterium]|nr:hypothetical protein [Pseudomonadota bacterium]
MTALDQDAMQFRQRLDRRLRRPQTQAGTRRSVQHPGGHCDDDTRRHLDMNDLTRRSVLAVLPAHPAAVQRVPAVKDLDFLPDMGRMTARWPWDAGHGCSSAANWPGSARPS